MLLLPRQWADTFIIIFKTAIVPPTHIVDVDNNNVARLHYNCAGYNVSEKTKSPDQKKRLENYSMTSPVKCSDENHQINDVTTNKEIER